MSYVNMDDTETQYIPPEEILYLKEEPSNEIDVSVPLSEGTSEFLQNALSIQGYPDPCIGSTGWSQTIGFSQEQDSGSYYNEVVQMPSLTTMSYSLDSQQLFPDLPSASLAEVQNLSQVLQNQELNLNANNNSQQSIGSQQSQDTHVQSIEIYPGEYDFGFKFPELTTKKFQYSAPLRKLFVLPSENMDVHFTYDYEKSRGTDLKLACFLRNSRTEDADKPVVKCIKHETQAKENVAAKKHATEAEKSHLSHVMVSANPKATHIKGADGRCRVEIPLKSPAAGSDYIPQLFSFSCMNSCNKSRWTAIFELQKKASGRVVGRQVFELKVCKCPSRDMAKEEPSPSGKKITKRPRAGCSNGEQAAASKRGRPSMAKPLRDGNGLLQDSIDELDRSSQEFSEDYNNVKIEVEDKEEFERFIKNCKKLYRLRYAVVPEVKLYGDAFKNYVDSEIQKLRAIKGLRIAVRNHRNENPSVGTVGYPTLFNERSPHENL